MDAIQSLFYGFGEVAYSVAMVDGDVQREEYTKFHELIEKGVKEYSIDLEYADLIFQILDHQHARANFAYETGIEAMELGSHHLTSELKVAFLEIVGDIANAFIPVTEDEAAIVARFAQDLDKMTKNLVIE